MTGRPTVIHLPTQTLIESEVFAVQGCFSENTRHRRRQTAKLQIQFSAPFPQRFLIMSETFRAYLIAKNDGVRSVDVVQISVDALMEGDVTVQVEYSRFEL